MAKRIYQNPLKGFVIKIRLQHTAPNDTVSPILEELAAKIDKSKFVAFNNPRLGTNPKYKGQQATAIYMEMNADEFVELINGNSGVTTVDIEFEDVTPKKGKTKAALKPKQLSLTNGKK